MYCPAQLKEGAEVHAINEILHNSSITGKNKAPQCIILTIRWADVPMSIASNLIVA